jgi:hypothetical protein
MAIAENDRKRQRFQSAKEFAQIRFMCRFSDIRRICSAIAVKLAPQSGDGELRCSRASRHAMPDAERLREQAEKALRLARQIADETVSARLATLAEEYLSKAEELERFDKP